MQQVILTNSLNKEETKDNLHGEREADCIFEAYYKRVYNYIYYRVNSHYTTEDLASQVFEKILLKINTYSEKKSPFEVWLFAIARNVVNDYYRSLKIQRIFSIDTIKELVSKEKTPEEIIVSEEMNDNLLQTMDILNKRERNIIALKFGANLRNKDIAEILDITESNVGVILYRLLKKLKQQIEREGLI